MKLNDEALMAHLVADFGSGRDLSEVLLHEIEDSIFEFICDQVATEVGYHASECDFDTWHEVAEKTAARLEASQLPT